MLEHDDQVRENSYSHCIDHSLHSDTAGVSSDIDCDSTDIDIFGSHKHTFDILDDYLEHQFHHTHPRPRRSRRTSLPGRWPGDRRYPTGG